MHDIQVHSSWDYQLHTSKQCTADVATFQLCISSLLEMYDCDKLILVINLQELQILELCHGIKNHQLYLCVRL